MITTIILYNTDEIIRRYWNTDSIEKTFTDRITYGKWSLENLSSVIFNILLIISSVI
jgi:hypothetical protein